MKNIHTRLFGLIILLAIGAGWAVATKPIRKGLDIQGGMRVILQAVTDDPTFVKKKGVWSQDKLETVASIMRRRVDSLGVSEPVVYPQGSDRVVVELPGVKNKEEALTVISSTAKLEFRDVKQLADGTWRPEPDPTDPGFERILGANGQPVSPDELKDKVFNNDDTLVATGADLLPNSKPQLTGNGYVVTFEFSGNAARVFEDYTRTHIGKPLAVFLDQKLISAPSIKDVIPGNGIIEGNFTAEQAKTLASQLDAGALPVPLRQLQLTNVQATLGRTAVKQTTIAGLVGLGAVLIFMTGFYLLPGVLADICLLLYALFTFAIFKLIPVTLTVPGIAGFILSIGMAVDANILIFERMKEERKSGKSLRASIETGFKRAFSAIFDSNVCTLITCGILYQFGTGQVRGFALTLAIGVIVSMFTAITCTRTFLLLVAGMNFGQNDALYGLNRGFHPKLAVTRNMAKWFTLSGLVIVPGLIFWGLGGIKKSIEFTGGTEVTAHFSQPVTVSDLTSALSAAGFKDPRIQLAEGNTAYITLSGTGRSRELGADERQRVDQVIQSKGGTDEGTQVVSGIISGELIQGAILSVVWASALIILYLALRFSIPNFFEGLKFGTCAVIALLHDVLVVWGCFAIFGYFLNWEIDSLFVTAMLTVIGFSVHDTIVIFDRIRENLHYRVRGETFADVADRSIEQTFARSVGTSVTVIMVLLALLILGGPVVRLFVTALLIGIISGTYSSIFNATPLLVLWKRLAGETGAAGPPTTPSAGRAGAVPRRGDGATTPRTATPANPVVPKAPVVTEEPREPVQAGSAIPGDRAKAKKKKQRRM